MGHPYFYNEVNLGMSLGKMYDIEGNGIIF